MAWRIHLWDGTTECGSVVSPHIGPLEFGAAQNPAGTTDFATGEVVVVEVEGAPGHYVVTSVRHDRPRPPRPQPERTECAESGALNAHRFSDAHFEESPAGEVRVWLGDCCAWCGPFVRVSFQGVVQVAGLEDDDDDFDVDSPRLRFASDGEMKMHGLRVGEGRRAYCLVATPNAPEDEASADLFVVAERACVSLHPRTR